MRVPQVCEQRLALFPVVSAQHPTTKHLLFGDAIESFALGLAMSHAAERAFRIPHAMRVPSGLLRVLGELEHTRIVALHPVPRALRSKLAEMPGACDLH